MKLQRTHELPPFVKILVYGRAGMGKTVLCSTAPDPLILSAESGLLSLADKEIPYIEIKTMEDLMEAYRFINESDEAKGFNTICLDSITEIGEVVLAKFKEENKDTRKAYGELNDEMAKILRKFRDLPHRHVYFSAKQGRLTDDYTGITSYVALMPGKSLIQNISFYFDEVGCLRLHEEDGYRYLQMQPDISYDAKDRSGKLDKVEKPDLSYLFDKILKKGEES